jgi:hypothetical protein
MLFLITYALEDFPVNFGKHDIAVFQQFLNFRISDAVVNVFSLPSIFQ